MSYILEALKKSEQERTRGIAPTVHAVHAEPFFHRTRFSFWHYGLAVAVLALSLFAVLHRPSPMAKHSATSSDLPSLTAGGSPRPPRATPALEVSAAATPPSVATSREPSSSKPARHHEKPLVADAVPVKEKRAKPLPTAAAPTPQDAPAPKPREETVARTPSKQDIIEMSELPQAVQRALPKLDISGYINNQDDPSGRMVGIGDKLVREGDEVAAGLKLEQIAGNRAVFAYKGYRFRVRLP